MLQTLLFFFFRFEGIYFFCFSPFFFPGAEMVSFSFFSKRLSLSFFPFQDVLTILLVFPSLKVFHFFFFIAPEMTQKDARQSFLGNGEDPPPFFVEPSIELSVFSPSDLCVISSLFFFPSSLAPFLSKQWKNSLSPFPFENAFENLLDSPHNYGHFFSVPSSISIPFSRALLPFFQFYAGY